MNAKKGLGNIITSFLNQFIMLSFGIIIPRLVLVNLGSEANGLMNTIGQVLTYVAVLEAGVGTASLQALYGPLGNQDYKTINGIVTATDKFYKRTGTAYFVIVVLLSIVFPFTIQTSLSRTTVMLVMLLSGMPGVINYYFQGKLKILLQAEGKNYVITNLATIIYIFTSIFKIILLLNGYGIVALQAMHLIFNLIQMLFYVIYFKKKYKWIDFKVKPDFNAISQSKNALVHQLSGLIFNNTDILILTYFCGLREVSVYSTYTLLFGMVEAVIAHFGGFNFILGQTFNKDKEKYLQYHEVYELYMMALTFSLFCIANIFILPFMKLYTAGVNDINYIDQLLPYLFITTYLLSRGRSSSSLVIGYAQHFKQTQGRSIIESLINIIISLIAVQKFGIYGVLIGTIAALLYRTNDMILYANKRILERNPWITYRRWLLNFTLFSAITVATKYIFRHIIFDSYATIVIWAVVCGIIIVPVFFCLVSMFDKETYRFAKSILVPYMMCLKDKL